MKKLLNTLLLILVLGGLSACQSDFDPQEDGNHRSKRVKNKPMVKTVRMSFGGDFITESEEPLLRADDGEFFAGINVWRKAKKDDTNEEKYAYGLFKKETGIEIELITGYTYRFEATILIEQKDKLRYDGGYAEPFMLKSSKDNDNNGVIYQHKLDEFQYTYNYSFIPGEVQSNSDRLSFYQLSKGTSRVVCADLPSAFTFSYPKVKRFYGTKSDFDPEINQPVEIPMNYKCFGLKIEVITLPSGYLTVQDITKVGVTEKNPNEKLVFPANFSLGLEDVDRENYYKKEWEGLFSMNKLEAEHETFKLQFVWHKGGSSTDTFECELTVHPGSKKTLKINVAGTPNYEQEGNIVLNMSDTSLNEEELTINRDADNNTTKIE